MKTMTNYERELERIDRDILELKGGLDELRSDIETTTRLAYRLYQRASLTGNLVEFDAVRSFLGQVLQEFGLWPDLCLLKANLEFKFHQVSEAIRSLNLVPALVDCHSALGLRADLDFHNGRYEDARKGYETAVQECRTWDNLARLAHFASKMGNADDADQLYVEAEDEITAKEMRSYAWVELQRGRLDLSHGRFDDARVHYQQAARAYSGYWLTDAHAAELLGAQGRFDDAIAAYKKVVACVPRPELQQAIGELYVAAGEADQAEFWFERALGAYLASAHEGGLHYCHHLADFYSDVRQDGTEAVKWARRDFELRRNFWTEAAFAWALYRAGQFAEALALICIALSSGVRDAHLYHQAATIYSAAGAAESGEELLRRAAEMNPHYEAFHAHH